MLARAVTSVVERRAGGGGSARRGAEEGPRSGSAGAVVLSFEARWRGEVVSTGAGEGGGRSQQG